MHIRKIPEVGITHNGSKDPSRFHHLRTGCQAILGAFGKISMWDPRSI